MMRLKKILLLITLLSTTCLSLAQQSQNEQPSDKYRLVHWGVDEGLGKGAWQNAIIKDVNGFVWFGSTHGELSRFDKDYPGDPKYLRFPNTWQSIGGIQTLNKMPATS